MMLFGGLFMLLLFVVLAVVGVAALVGLPAVAATFRRPATQRTCASCGRVLRDDWRVCPYDGTEVRMGA